MRIKIFFQQPDDLQRIYLSKDQVETFLKNFHLDEWKFLMPFKRIELFVNGFQELPGHGILCNDTKITVLFERNF